MLLIIRERYSFFVERPRLSFFFKLNLLKFIPLDILSSYDNI
jgi:hypothetical protein